MLIISDFSSRTWKSKMQYLKFLKHLMALNFAEDGHLLHSINAKTLHFYISILQSE